MGHVLPKPSLPLISAGLTRTSPPPAGARAWALRLSTQPSARLGFPLPPPPATEFPGLKEASLNSAGCCVAAWVEQESGGEWVRVR